ncbi:uncharacterized protein LOC116346493 [Contarinia nasturtii]|uniref:uncharacterized protein LOC116346493 n=1 Tax=Contarinia nasturtii TaxID=265458 RepID=UPI0012D3F47E|nr:uncharacterized protein LOC116346493 [Contarinia nasturtii]
MADQKANFVAKCQPEGTNEPEPKHPRTDDGEGPATSTTQLTDVVDDCLERIFMHLSLEDFLNIAHTNKELKPAADMAFQRKFGKTEFYLCDEIYFGSDDDIVEISDKKSQLRLLRCFGHLITKLEIEGEFAKKLIGYANEYCFNSLTAINIAGFDYIRNNLLPKPFANVEVVKLFNCKFCADTNFKKWFPAIRRLELDWCSTFTKGMFIVKNIPQLEHLKICYDSDIRPKNICTSLRNNPQLRSLWLGGIVPPKGFWQTCQTLSQLESIQIESAANFKNVDTAVNFPALKKLDINIEENDLRLMTSEENLITFGQLKNITLQLPLCSSINSLKWSNFFKKNQSIEKVSFWLQSDSRISETIMTAAAQELPLLKELNHFSYGFSIDQIFDFIGKFNVMNYSFLLKSRTEFDILKNRLGAEWNASIYEGFCIKLNRKP